MRVVFDECLWGVCVDKKYVWWVDEEDVLMCEICSVIYFWRCRARFRRFYRRRRRRGFL